MGGYYQNISPEERRRLESFRQEKAWREWMSTLHPNTKPSYGSSLFRVLGRLELTPTQLVNLAENPNTQKELSKRVKILFAQLQETYSYSARNIMLSSLRNFLAFHEIALPLIGFKLKVERKNKPFFPWDDALRVIDLAAIEYQNVYKVMLWGALDVERFIKLNVDKARLAAIRTQLEDKTRDWIRVDVPKGRKHSPAYYVLVPPHIARLLPVLDQEGRPITSKNSIHYHWQNALHRAGFDYEHFGPHNLRSAWTVEATKRGLQDILLQFQKGHDVDSQHYQRIQQDENWVTEQFRKAWETQPLVTEDALLSRDALIEDLKARLQRLESISTERLVLAAGTMKQTSPGKRKRSTRNE